MNKRSGYLSLEPSALVGADDDGVPTTDQR